MSQCKFLYFVKDERVRIFFLKVLYALQKHFEISNHPELVTAFHYFLSMQEEFFESKERKKERANVGAKHSKWKIVGDSVLIHLISYIITWRIR